MKLHETFLKPMHPEGRRFVAIFAAITLGLFLLAGWLGWVGVGLTVWGYYFFRDPHPVTPVPLLLCVWVVSFFRDPHRVTPARAGVVVSPADGIVSGIEKTAPPPELGLGAAPMTRISVFMSVFNCHVNRAPAAGRVRRIAYRPGRFVSASLDKASEDNERNSLVIEMTDGRQLVVVQTLAVVQIAGLVARRIVCFVTEGAHLERGERFGLIRFGSRLDVYLPESAVALVREGQTMIAGETVIAEMTR